MKRHWLNVTWVEILEALSLKNYKAGSAANFHFSTVTLCLQIIGKLISHDSFRAVKTYRNSFHGIWRIYSEMY